MVAHQLWRTVPATVLEQATLVLAVTWTLMSAYSVHAPMELVLTTTEALVAFVSQDILGLLVTSWTLMSV